MSKTMVRFRQYGTKVTLPIIRRAKIEIRARAEARIDNKDFKGLLRRWHRMRQIGDRR